MEQCPFHSAVGIQQNHLLTMEGVTHDPFHSSMEVVYDIKKSFLNFMENKNTLENL